MTQCAAVMIIPGPISDAVQCAAVCGPGRCTGHARRRAPPLPKIFRPTSVGPNGAPDHWQRSRASVAQTSEHGQLICVACCGGAARTLVTRHARSDEVTGGVTRPRRPGVTRVSPYVTCGHHSGVESWGVVRSLAGCPVSGKAGSLVILLGRADEHPSIISETAGQSVLMRFLCAYTIRCV